MKQKRNCRNILFSLLFFLLFTMLFPLSVQADETSAEAAPEKTVRVGYFYDGNFMNKSDDGTYSGYDVEYLYEIGNYTGWHYEFVDFSSFEEEYKALQTGKIDLLPALFYSDERAHEILLSVHDMGSVYVNLIVPDSDTVHNFNDYGSFGNLTVGILKDTIDGQRFKEWNQDKGVNAAIREYDSNDQLFAALDSGEISAIAETYFGAKSGCHSIARFSPMQMYFGISPSRPGILSTLNDAMDEISVETPEFQENLYQRYFSSSTGEAPSFTAAEKAYLAQGKTISLAVSQNDPPYSYLNSKGELVGAIIDFYGKVSELSGIRFTFIKAASVVDSMQLVKDGKADAAAKVNSDLILANGYDMWLTNPYLSLTLTYVTKPDVKEIKKVALPKNIYSIYSKLVPVSGNMPEAIVCSTSRECFHALDSGKADAVLINTGAANYYINMSRPGAYTITDMNAYSYNVACGVSNQKEHELFSILNKCMFYMPAASVDELVIKYTTSENSSFINLINRVPYWVIIIVVGILLLSVMLLGIMLFILRRGRIRDRVLANTREEAMRSEEALRVSEKSNEVKTEFLGSMSHDMRTPLNAVLGYSELALGTDNQSEKDGYLAKIRQSGNLLLNLVNSTLMISKLQNGKYHLSFEKLSFSEVFDEIVVSVSEAAQKKGISFHADFSGEHFHEIYADKLNTQKIFLNLLSNAVNYTDKGGQIWFEAEQIDGDGFNLRATVKDTGIGISPEFLPELFKPFTQEKRSPGDNSGGTGLGMSIVKELVDLMGGKITVESTPGKGTAFTVYLKLREAAAEQDGPDTENEGHPAPADRLSGKRVLLCEDNLMNQEIASVILKKRNMQTDVANNGQEGLEKFLNSESGAYAAVLMDIRMPVMNGYEAAAAIRASEHPDAKTVPIIAMTADAYPDDIVRAKSAGMNGHIAKPINTQLLYSTLEQFL